ncbi:MAG: PhzF family phenazine biosynthesis protein, partial [Sedimentisphaerales bacterium]|nr:PhzF family phenazine biosynthesis protein [Sedimentisphaerales bacterium]
IQDKIEHWAHQIVTLNLKVGPIPVNHTALDNHQRLLWLKAPQPQFDACFSPQDFAPILNLDIPDFDERFPIQSVSTGLPFILVPLRTLDAVRRAKANLEAFASFLKMHDTARMMFIFCPQAQNPANHIHCRMFGHLYGVPEDPATGSANSCLAAYLTRYRYFGDSSIDIRVEQGYEMGRPSLLYLQAQQHNDTFDLRVGGKTHIIAAGTLI